MQALEAHPDVVDRLVSRVREITQLRITERNRADLVRVAEERARASELAIGEWIDRLGGPGSTGDLEHVIRELTVGETYLFRGPVFDAIRKAALPELCERRARDGSRVLRLCSAGCATGEEAYSLAILALEAIGDLSGWHVSVLGIDVNTQFLERAEEASYGRWSLRDAPSSTIERYFDRDGEQWRVKPLVRSLVRFQYANLALDPLPAPALGVVGMDLLLCQNVLYYFEPSARERLITSLSHALSPDGYLFFGPADLVSAEIPICHMQHIDDVTAYRRMGRLSSVPRRRPKVLASLPPPIPTPTPVVAPDAPVASPPRFAMALALADDGDVISAVGELEALLAADRDHVSGHVLHGFLLAELGEHEAALDAFRRAIYLDPKSLLANVGALTVARRLARVELTRRFESRVRALAESQPRDQRVAGWEGMTTGRLLSLFRDATGGAR